MVTKFKENIHFLKGIAFPTMISQCFKTCVSFKFVLLVICKPIKNVAIIHIKVKFQIKSTPRAI